MVLQPKLTVRSRKIDRQLRQARAEARWHGIGPARTVIQLLDLTGEHYRGTFESKMEPGHDNGEPG